jgi:hypothetical protein
MAKKKVRKPRIFGVRDEIRQVTFDIDKEDLCLRINGRLTLDTNGAISIESKWVRWLSTQFGKTADYLDQLETDGE